MTNAELKRRRHRAASRRYYRKMADKLRAQGLCIFWKRRGQPRKYAYHYFDLRGDARRNAINKKRRDDFAAQGLTTKGTPRKVQLHHLQRAVGGSRISSFPKDSPERKAYNANAAARHALYRARNLAAGLTAKGKPRKDGLAPRTAIELAWRELRASMNLERRLDWSDAVIAASDLAAAA